MAKRAVVGLIVITEVPGFGRVAVLQRRGEFNHEKMEPESWPGGCQTTARGKAEKDENVVTAMLREVKEELGDQFLKIVKQGLLSGLVKDAMQTELNSIRAITYCVHLPADCLTLISFGPSTGGMVLVTEDGLNGILDLTQFDKVNGVTDRRIVAMFPDEKEAVRRAFEILK